MPIILLIAALLPAVLLWWYIWKKDPQKEPTSQLIRAMLYGAGICLPVALIEYVVQTLLFGGSKMPTTFLGSMAMAFFVAAIPEEGFKLLALRKVLHHNPYFDEHFDGIVYAVCVGLGFAAMENIGYVVSGVENWLMVAATRALLSVPGHYAFAVLMGYYYSVYYFVNRSMRNKVMILLVPVLGHGIYDTIALSSIISPVVGGVATILLVYFCIKVHQFAHKKVLAQIQKDQESHTETGVL
jgi:RsiW-degrading membrane proteinase PrsW (M82 family)